MYERAPRWSGSHNKNQHSNHQFNRINRNENMRTNSITPPLHRAHPRGAHPPGSHATRAAGRWLTTGAALGLLLFTGMAQAATLTVLNNGDSGADTLRGVIAGASAGDTLTV